jgi:steroid 5-alpha reductase family enzyme
MEIINIINLIPNLFQIITGLIISYVILFIISIILKDNSIADIFWGIGFSQLAIHTLLLNPNKTIFNYIFTIIILIWTLRISGYILSKKLKTKTEDKRYAIWRETWKYFYIRSFFQVYILQGILMIIISTSILIINSSNNFQNSIFFIIGTIVALGGLIFETVSDKQLFKFLSNPKNKGQIMQTGLWKYSRHPNYYGESIFWLGISILAIQISYIGLISYIMITFLLRFVSGVPLAEKTMKQNKYFIEYAKKTPAFIPNFLIK